jgi:hypothetical protein
MNIDMSGTVDAAKEGVIGERKDKRAANNRNTMMSRRSVAWDTNQKGFLTDSERYAKEADKDGKGYLTGEEARELASRFAKLSQENKKIRRMLLGLLVLVILLAAGTIAATFYAVQYNKELTIDEGGHLSAADGGGEVSVKQQGIKLFMYTESSKYCITSSDLALAWSENENGGAVSIITETPDGDELVERLTQTSSKMTKDVVSFGDLEFYPDPDCGNGGSAEDAHRSLKDHVRALREGYLIPPRPAPGAPMPSLATPISAHHPTTDRKLTEIVGYTIQLCPTPS